MEVRVKGGVQERVRERGRGRVTAAVTKMVDERSPDAQGRAWEGESLFPPS